MNKFFLISALLAIVSGAKAEVITLTPNATYSGGGITGPGTTVSGNLVTWNSTTGAAVADSGIAASNVPLLNVSNYFTHNITVQSATQYTGLNIYNGTNQVAKLWGNSATNDIGVLNLLSGGTLNVNLNSGGNSYINGNLGVGGITVAYPLDVTGNIRTTTGLLINGSTVIDTIQSGNTSAQARTITFPNTGNATDTLALLAAGQTFSGANTFSGATTLSGSMLVSSTGTPATFSANGQVEINAGTTAPTFNASYPNTLAIGGTYTSPPNLTSGGGNIFVYTSGNGLALQGGAISLLGPTGSAVAQTTYKGLTVNNELFSGGTVPSTNTGGCTTIGAATGGGMAGKFATTASCGSGTTVTLVWGNAAPNGYVCDAHDQTTPATYLNQTTYTTTSVTFTTTATTGTTDTIVYKCMGF